MQQFNSKAPAGATEKFVRWLPFIGLGIVGFYFWGTISAFVVMTLKNTLKTVIYGGILAAIVLYVWSNPQFIWMTYKNICKKITSFFIKMDPLSYMDRYADILSKKLSNLNKTRVNLEGEKVRLERQIEQDKTVVERNLKIGAAAKQENNDTQLSLAGMRAKGARDSISLYLPNLNRTRRNLEFMNTLAENWDAAIISLRETTERKRTEWRILSQNAKALNLAEAFLRGDTEEGRVYQESIKTLEQQVTQKIAYIEDFEKRAKPILEGARIEKRMNENEGTDMIEEYMKDGKLMMPDFNQMFSSPQDVEYEEIKPGKFNLLNNKK